MIHLFAIIGMFTCLFFAYLLHVLLLSEWKAYKRFNINVSNVFFVPYFYFRVSKESTATLERMARYMNGKHWSVRLCRKWLDKELEKRKDEPKPQPLSTGDELLRKEA